MLRESYISTAAVNQTFVPPFQAWVDRAPHPGESPALALRHFAKLESMLRLGCPGNLTKAHDDIQRLLVDDLSRILPQLEAGIFSREAQQAAAAKFRQFLTSDKSFEALFKAYAEFISDSRRSDLVPHIFFGNISSFYSLIANHPEILRAIAEDPSWVACLGLSIAGDMPTAIPQDWKQLWTQTQMASEGPQVFERDVLLGMAISCLRTTQGRWVDIGTGNGASLCAMGRTFPHLGFLGIDCFQSVGPVNSVIEGRNKHLNNKPSNVRYALMKPRSVSEDLSGIECVDYDYRGDLGRIPLGVIDRTLNGILEKNPIHGASILYPYVPKIPDQNIDLQMETLLRHLPPQGMGLVITEKPAFMNRLLSMAAGAFSRFASFGYSEKPFSRKQLGALGITPFSPDNRTIGKEGPEINPHETFGSFDWGYPLVIVKS